MVFTGLKYKYDIGNRVSFKFKDGRVYEGIIKEITLVYKSWPDKHFNYFKIMYTICTYFDVYPGMASRIEEEDISPVTTIEDWV